MVRDESLRRAVAASAPRLIELRERRGERRSRARGRVCVAAPGVRGRAQARSAGDEAGDVHDGDAGEEAADRPAGSQPGRIPPAT